MDVESQKALASMNSILDRLLSGKQCDRIEIYSPIPELQKLSEQLNQLINNLNEMNSLAVDISEGRLDGTTHPRHNYMSAPLKQLHSQLSILTLSLQQLQSGYVVSKMECTGELFTAFNGLIDQVAEASMQDLNAMVSNTPSSVNSWRYHQILQALNLLHILVLEVDSAGRVVYANRPAKEVLGDIDCIPSEQQENDLLSIIAELSQEKSEYPAFREVYEEGRGTWYHITSDKFLLPNGQTLYLHMIEDISAWKINEHQLVLSASMDRMTGTFNRTAGMEELDRILTCGDSSQMYCIAFIDIDGLKKINDTYGHSEGDYAIKSVAKILLTTVRSTDTVCRYGGDEFFIIFKICTEKAAEKVMNNMYEKIKKQNDEEPRSYQLSFSHGITSFYPNSVVNVADLIATADKKMYDCKTRKLNNGNSAEDASNKYI
jgi:diguanylate cyclase (GGDEF)-like protein